MAAVFWLSFKRLAMVWRRRVIFTRSSRGSSDWARGAGAAAEGAGAEPDSAFSTSSFMTRPSLPVPATSDRLFSAISFFAEGASSTSLAAGAGAGSALGASAFGAGATSPAAIWASKASTPTVSPSAATISDRVPATGLGTSTVTLSVSSSHSISSTATLSPGCLNHVATVASVTDSPRVGTRTSVLISLILRV